MAPIIKHESGVHEVYDVSDTGDLVPRDLNHLAYRVDDDRVPPPPREDEMPPPRTNGNGNGNGNGAAWYGLPVWARIVFIFGAPTAIALGMVINSELVVKTGLSEIETKVEAVAAFDQQHHRDVTRTLDEIKSGTTETNRLLLQLCMMQAKTEAAVKACIGR
jgi:hypothetical protein